ncbi:exonuclease family protein [Purpureocillium lavendulum]|uniref:Exonuclease family protein n=1 Tax=Purpureocillium lavendulum TaxID=1247861 RepID=A0AB34G3U6_9HYPO|nr:exonuclease family protein [Purpureocillium lavendulum]
MPTGPDAERAVAGDHGVKSATDDPLVWIDCEMTGLDPDKEEILEIYCIVTTGNLEILDDQGFHAVVHWPQSRLEQMDEWCTTTHGNSGLTASVLSSTMTPEEAADSLYRYVTKLIPERRKGLLAGNSVHADRAFLRRGPYAKVMDHLHYRLLDVSAIKEAARRWSPKKVVNKVPSKKGRHVARDDILESIEEARYYRDVIFRGASGAASS